MRLVLVSYFDLAETYGLDDEAFPKEHRTAGPDIGLVGIRNPLGQGLALELGADAPQVVKRWRAEAIAQTRRPEMELNRSPEISPEEFDGALERLLAEHPVTSCRLTVYAVGAVYVWLEFAEGIPVSHLHAVGRCFEFAAYRPWVSQALYDAARRYVDTVLGVKRSRLAALTRRSPAEDQTDAAGYRESRLLSTGFTRIVMFLDDADKALRSDVAVAMQLTNAQVIDFEYHGRLHYSWGTSLVEPRELGGNTSESRAELIARMLTCIQIAHTFLGTCEAFDRLFRSEVHTQVGGYVGKRSAGRGPEDLNRLRTLALAVVNLTKFDLVTVTAEDRGYFRLFAADSQIAELHASIQETCEVLYNVQLAEQESQMVKRQNALNLIVALLASFALISVSTDVYSYLSGGADLIPQRRDRGEVLVELFGAVILIAAVVVYLFTPRRGRRRR